MTKEQPSATLPSLTADGTTRAISRQPAPWRKCPSSYACFGPSTGCRTSIVNIIATRFDLALRPMPPILVMGVWRRLETHHLFRISRDA